MNSVLAALALHVGMGAAWALTTIGVAVTGRARPLWLRLMLGLALLNMLAGIYLWHALHSGAWGPAEHLLVGGTFYAFVALGLQAPTALAAEPGTRRLAGPALWTYRASAVLIVAAAAAMIAAKA